MLETLSAFRGQHSSAGLVEGELQLVELYNETLAHLDAACDGLMLIMNR
eukprot:CAMPEP_0202837512 /NCGR_PEP_ID=MMETSP1389-20130828/46089_1 /ASSEMBLY_ACC=CAM_ASM_000865 /TAXON_ID=302021 /ORGANISM="Rhodomonas sp., Strain CCMP768" /LENGTH=48 /DNA_ID= /DNA_START= /DNA_END= /DNA_ORIENTATION=